MQSTLTIRKNLGRVKFAADNHQFKSLFFIQNLTPCFHNEYKSLLNKKRLDGISY